MTTIRNTPLSVRPHPRDSASPPTPATTSELTSNWDQFQDAFIAAPATQLKALRAKATEIGHPELVAPLSGLAITDSSHHSVASNVLNHYPVRDIYDSLLWSEFERAFLAAPATQLELLRAKALEAGKPELVAPLSGLKIRDDGHHSIASNILRNYPIQDIYAQLHG